ncbi:MAG TPA: type II toxin-antitoxin system VapC family toxin [Solirubrobacteraceae bacterium]|nr:type II toxin-antitoxin system VapC family toxin [Solirubrobacteraceae bacterium]
MIVADSSAIAEVLLAQRRADAILDVLSVNSELHVPAHFHAEVLSALRRYSLRGMLNEAVAIEAVKTLTELRTLTYPIRELIPAIWKLRFNLTTYDAAYLALARWLDAGLITLDDALAKAAGRDGRLISV